MFALQLPGAVGSCKILPDGRGGGGQAVMPPGRLPQTPRLRSGHTLSFGPAVQGKGLCCSAVGAERRTH